jgi:hypothetical protein
MDVCCLCLCFCRICTRVLVHGCVLSASVMMCLDVSAEKKNFDLKMSPPMECKRCFAQGPVDVLRYHL